MRVRGGVSDIHLQALRSMRCGDGRRSSMVLQLTSTNPIEGSNFAKHSTCCKIMQFGNGRCSHKTLDLEAKPLHQYTKTSKSFNSANFFQRDALQFNKVLRTKLSLIVKARE